MMTSSLLNKVLSLNSDSNLLIKQKECIAKLLVYKVSKLKPILLIASISNGTFRGIFSGMNQSSFIKKGLVERID